MTVDFNVFFIIIISDASAYHLIYLAINNTFFELGGCGRK